METYNFVHGHVQQLSHPYESFSEFCLEHLGALNVFICGLGAMVVIHVPRNPDYRQFPAIISGR